MTQTIAALIKLLTDKGFTVTTAALLNKKTPTETATSGEGVKQ